MRQKTAAPPDPMEHYRYKGDLRTADGKMPMWQWGNYFALSQGELHHHPDYQAGRLYCGIHWSIGLLRLNNGKWLARPVRDTVNEYTVRSRQFDTREQALRAAVAHVIRMARERYRWDDAKFYGSSYPTVRAPFGWKLTHEQAQSTISWACALLGRQPPRLLVARPRPEPISTARVDEAAKELDQWLRSKAGKTWRKTVL